MCCTSTFWKCVWFENIGSITKVMNVEVKNVPWRFCPFLHLESSDDVSEKLLPISTLSYSRTLSSYRLSETKEIRTLVHYHLATLKKIFSLLPSYHENFFFVLGCACAQQVIFFFFALTSCGPPTHPGYSHAHCTCRSASVLLLLSLASQIFCGLASAFGLFCILVLDGQCTVGAWRAARSWCACCLGEPWARGSVMNRSLQPLYLLRIVTQLQLVEMLACFLPCSGWQTNDISHAAFTQACWNGAKIMAPRWRHDREKKFPVLVSETKLVKVTLPCFKTLTAADLSPKDDFDQLFNFQGPVISECTIMLSSIVEHTWASVWEEVWGGGGRDLTWQPAVKRQSQVAKATNSDSCGPAQVKERKPQQRTASTETKTKMESNEYQKLLEIEKEIVSELVRGDKHNLRKSANCKAQIGTMWGVDNSLCVANCRFSLAVFVTSNNFTHNLLFYFQ